MAQPHPYDLPLDFDITSTDAVDDAFEATPPDTLYTLPYDYTMVPREDKAARAPDAPPGVAATLVYWAAAYGAAGTVDHIIDKYGQQGGRGGVLTPSPATGSTALHAACTYSQWRIAAALVAAVPEAGKIADAAGCVALQCAIHSKKALELGAGDEGEGAGEAAEKEQKKTPNRDSPSRANKSGAGKESSSNSARQRLLKTLYAKDSAWRARADAVIAIFDSFVNTQLQVAGVVADPMAGRARREGKDSDSPGESTAMDDKEVAMDKQAGDRRYTFIDPAYYEKAEEVFAKALETRGAGGASPREVLQGLWASPKYFPEFDKYFPTAPLRCGAMSTMLAFLQSLPHAEPTLGYTSAHIAQVMATAQKCVKRAAREIEAVFTGGRVDDWMVVLCMIPRPCDALDCFLAGSFYTCDLVDEENKTIWLKDPEILSSGHGITTRTSQKLPLYFTMNTALREAGDFMMRNLGVYTGGARGEDPNVFEFDPPPPQLHVLKCFQPLIFALDQCIRVLPCESRVVYRGLNINVSSQYRVGCDVVWNAFSSTSLKKSVAMYFMNGVTEGTDGTFFVIVSRQKASNVAFCATYVAEDELLYSSGIRFQVQWKLSPTLLRMMNFSFDIVVMAEVVDNAEAGVVADEDSDKIAVVLDISEKIVDVFGDYLKRYVEARIGASEHTTVTCGLRTKLREWIAPASRKNKWRRRPHICMQGFGGSGKTSAGIAAMAELCLEGSTAGRRRVFAIFIPLPVVQDQVLTPGGLDKAVRTIYGITKSQQVLLGRVCDVVLILDSLDEVNLSKKQIVEALEANGIQTTMGARRSTAGRRASALSGDAVGDKACLMALHPWCNDNCSVILTSRTEYLKAHRIRPDELLGGNNNSWYIQPFVEADVQEYIDRWLGRDKPALEKEIQLHKRRVNGVPKTTVPTADEVLVVFRKTQMMGLITNPFVLMMATTAFLSIERHLERVVAAQGTGFLDAAAKQGQLIHGAHIYEAYLEHSIGAGLRRGGLEGTHTVESVMRVGEAIACAMLDAGRWEGDMRHTKEYFCVEGRVSMFAPMRPNTPKAAGGGRRDAAETRGKAKGAEEVSASPSPPPAGARGGGGLRGGARGKVRRPEKDAAAEPQVARRGSTALNKKDSSAKLKRSPSKVGARSRSGSVASNVSGASGAGGRRLSRADDTAAKKHGGGGAPTTPTLEVAEPMTAPPPHGGPHPPDFIDACLRALPLRVEDFGNADSLYQFRHKSLAEYLVARRAWRDPGQTLGEFVASRTWSTDTPMVRRFFLQEVKIAKKDEQDRRLREVVALVTATRDRTRCTVRVRNAASNAMSLVCTSQSTKRYRFTSREERVSALVGGSKAPVSRADFSGVWLRNCDLRTTLFVDISFRGAKFDNCWMERVQFHNCDLHDTTWENCHFGTPLPPLTGHRYGVRCGVLCPEETYLATGSWDCSVRVWDLTTGRCVKTVRLNETEGIEDMALSPEGLTLILACCNGSVLSFSLNHGLSGFSAADKRTELCKHSGDATTVCFDHAASHVISGGAGGVVYVTPVYEKAFDAVSHTLDKHRGRVECVTTVLPPAGGGAEWIVSCGRDTTIKVWNKADGSLVRELLGHPYPVLAVAAGGDGRVVSGSDDKTVKVWNVCTGELLQTLTDYHGPVNAVAISPDGHKIVSGGQGKKVLVHNMFNGKLTHSFDGHKAGINSVICVQSGDRIFSCAEDNTVLLWEVTPSTERWPFVKGHAGDVNTVSTDGHMRAATGADDGLVIVWDLTTARPLQTLKGHVTWVSTVKFLESDTSKLLSGSWDMTVRFWDIDTGEELRRFTHPKCVDLTWVSRDDSMLISSDRSATIRFWDIQSGQALERSIASEELANHPMSIGVKAPFAPASKAGIIYTVEKGASVRAYDLDALRAGKEFEALWELPAGRTNISKVWPTLDGVSVALITGNSVVIYDVATKAEKYVLNVPQPITSVRISPDGVRMAVAYDTDFAMYDVETGAQQCVVEAHNEKILGISMNHPKYLVTCCVDESIRIWTFPLRTEYIPTPWVDQGKKQPFACKLECTIGHNTTKPCLTACVGVETAMPRVQAEILQPPQLITH